MRIRRRTIRCKACNKPIEGWVPLFFKPDGFDEVVMEDLCGSCLFIIRADLSGTADPEIIDILTHQAGINFDYEPSQEG